jgi:mono/diheme cytochrome c family protein
LPAACAALLASIVLLLALPRNAKTETPAEPASSPTFYRDVAPILERHCQSCHRPQGIGPFRLLTYEDASSWAEQISDAVARKQMPPWFADPCCGHFSDDPSLTPNEVSTIVRWAESHAPAGNPHDAPPAPEWVPGWNIALPDVVLTMPEPVEIPLHGDVEYTYEIVPTGFTEGKWIQMSEIRPSDPQHVHHAVVYIRPPESKWLRAAPLGVPFSASSLADRHLEHEAHATDSDMLLVYAPGSSPDRWPDGMAKFVPAHSDLVFQMHYTTNGRSGRDATRVGMVLAKTPTRQRVLTLQLANEHDQVPIPPGAENYRVEVHGTLPHDALLLSFFPHMHLRGKKFEYDIVHHLPSGATTLETLLRVNYDFYWQLSYRLAEPRLLPAGTELRATAWYDNSRKNAHNPDPDSPVSWGDQTYNEMMVGFFDVAVPASMDKWSFFLRNTPAPAEGKKQ